ncbi:MAG: hypothetical protein KGK10_07465 [Rhodospirillales bacterium]|nr:hypothetical protein [Rhodospirillales bacterium]
MRVRFAILTSLLLALAGCAGSAPPPAPYPALRYAYLTKLRLNVAKLAIDDSWVPSGEATHVEYLAPEQPVTALRQMAEDRLELDGTSGMADFGIDDASIIQVHDHYDAHFAVHLTLLDANGKPLGSIKAAVKDSRTFMSDSPQAQKSDLYELLKTTMNDMNVEFEYQMRKHLGKYLLAAKPLAPPPPSVQTQTLGQPGSPPPSFPATPAAPSNGAAPTPLTPPGAALPPPTTTAPVPDAAVPAGQTVINKTLAPTLTPMGAPQAPLPAVPAGALHIQTAPASP